MIEKKRYFVVVQYVVRNIYIVHVHSSLVQGDFFQLILFEAKYF